MIIPSIDIMDGKAVQLRQGKEKILEKENIFELAQEFSKYGEIAVIDLDATLGKGSNKELIKKLCRKYDCRVGGGIRDHTLAYEYLKAGAKKIIIGTKAVPSFLEKLPKNRIIVAIDSISGNIVNEGWTSETDQTTFEKISEVQNYCSEFLYTDVKQEGMLHGINLEVIKKVISASDVPITVAGGITTLDDIKVIQDLGANTQIGMAIYTGKIDLCDAFLSLVDFSKNNGIVPSLVEDTNGQILMQAYSTRDSLAYAFKHDTGTYFSRTRDKLWTKGQSSGNRQKLRKIRYDCDRDSLLFTVDQEGVACHKGQYSCFGDQKFNLYQLYDIIKDRIENPIEGSYTSKIARDEVMIKQKLQEEMQEVINYEDRENLVWELADVTYFLLMMMAKNDISYQEVIDELWSRRK